ncbi:uncharacterized protein LOC143623852 [Bidens hawaiensis]|uniref:uncharacterized protein LOC143623852 n=1 Tax=Bidens hawaiensis TaxID=980011 RepID=UPI00404B24C3
MSSSSSNLNQPLLSPKRRHSALVSDVHSTNVSDPTPVNNPISGHISCVLGLGAASLSTSLFTYVRNNLRNQPNPCISLSGSTSTSSCFNDLGDCTLSCKFCGALFWNDERITSVPLSRRPRYNQCCKGGRVRLPLHPDPPMRMKNLIERQDYLNGVRAYNSMFAMTSFGAKVDHSVNNGSAPYVLKVQGQISHWLGSMCPLSGQPPRFLQMYVYDTANVIRNRLTQFNQGEDGDLKEDIVRSIVCILDDHNELVKLFRTARDLCSSNNVPEFHVRLYNSVREMSYDMPAPKTIGAIVHETISGANDFDIVVHQKDDHQQRINKLNSLYMPLQYPLLFIYGERGWSPNMRLRSYGNNTNKNLTINMYYSFMIHDRHSHYSVILRGVRLFQQCLVDAYICIEQSRLDYIRSNQNLFRSEFLQGIYDVMSKGDTEGHSVGRRVILPSSFTGGPRYMYKHYHDALAICRVYGNPRYFITFTCNVKWLEIVRFMSHFPCLKAQDRPDIISRIFQLKVEAFRKYLKHKQPFGPVIADLYTLEFQKRGLPHCHILIWVSAVHKIIIPEDLDRHISAVVPDPNTEPDLYKIVTESMMHGPCGLAKPNVVCMKVGTCSKSFPKRYQSRTTFDKNGYVHYKRPANGFCVKKNGVDLDNAYVVPYNKKLCLHFNAHINLSPGQHLKSYARFSPTYYFIVRCRIRLNSGRISGGQWLKSSQEIPKIFAVEAHDCVPEETLHQYVLYELEFLLNSYATDSSFKKYGLPMPNSNLIRSLQNRLLMEEKNYDREELAQQHNLYIQSLHPQQREVYDHVTTSLEANNQVLAFVYGHGGKVVLTVAASGIASLLPSGRTAHSRFKIPINLTDNLNCNISKNTQLSKILVEAALNIWDEAPMSNRKCFEALDRSLKDILDNNKDPFGGKSILLGGDFRQTLPIRKNASKSEIYRLRYLGHTYGPASRYLGLRKTCVFCVKI